MPYLTTQALLQASPKFQKRGVFTVINITNDLLNQKNLSAKTLANVENLNKKMKKMAESLVEVNQELTLNNKPNLVTAQQLKMSFKMLDQLLEQNNELEQYAEKIMNNLMYRMDPIKTNIKAEHRESHKQNNFTKQILNEMEKAIYEIKPGRNETGKLTHYGKKLQNEMGAESFARATQLLTNQLAYESSFKSTTDAHIHCPPGSYASTWKDPAKVYGVERQVNKTDLSEDDMIFCMDDQLKLVELFQRDGKLEEFSQTAINDVIYYIKTQAEVLVNADKLKSSYEVAQKSQTIIAEPIFFSQEKNQRGENDYDKSI